ncbi:ABC transporter substrate-binding protein [Paucibacter sp. B2R-40]|uniref:ABC transporter substrate-binding protein n=1 Tax=Paucibacter sp. B2R-40 TaxID=2893554 RepID=UPI0021E515F4|nr:ABC transporter substrate-binding protein [Paucibacter sp. B2R-40]MCV2352550.1 ABC transporter substrate-binding protein [Paucibacter sp. B2R-40]
MNCPTTLFKRSLMRCALALLGLAPLQAGAAPQPPAVQAAPSNQSAHVLRYAFPIAETGFDPAQIADEYSSIIASNIFEAPLTYDYLARPIQLKGLTAEGPLEANADFTVFTLKIKPGIYFADDPAFKGKPRELTAADYVYAIKRNFDPRWKSPNFAALQGEKMLGLDQLREAATKGGKPFDYDRPVEGLQALDRYTLRIKLEQPNPRFAHNLAHLSAAAVAREVVELYGDQIMAHPVGTGPFKLSDWRRSSRMVLAKNPQFRESYYDEHPNADDAAGQAIAQQMKGRRLPLLDRVEVSIVSESQPLWLAFLGDEFDLIAVPYAYVGLAAPGGKLAPHLAKRGMNLHKMPLSDLVFTYFNMADAMVGGYTPERVALRRAIALAYDNEEEIRQLRKRLAVPAQGIVVPNTFGYQADFKTEMSEHSPAKARALLDLYGYVDKDGDGWRDQPDGKPLVLEFHTQPDHDSRQYNELWKKHMDAIGVRIEFKAANWPEQLKMARAGKLMMWMLSQTATKPDAQDLLAMGYGPSIGEDNLVRFELPEYDRLFEQIKALPDGPERQALIQRALRLLTVYMPMKAHVHRISLRLTQPWVQGYQPHPFLLGFWRFVDSTPPAKQP